MANPEHLAILKQGVQQWNKWREENSDVVPDLRKAGLSGADLDGANLRGARLSGADLSWANLRGADLRGAYLIGVDLFRTDLGTTGYSDQLVGEPLWEPGTDLRGANLRWANLRGANLRGAHLSGADLSRAGLEGANLGAADLSGVVLTEATVGRRVTGTIFANVDLSVVKGLETVRHYGPSTIGVDTIYESHGNIPEVFLRGCGVPDEFIAYIGSMVGRPIEFYSCFISYSTKDQEFADRLYADLQSKGVRCWFAPHDIQGGRKLHEQLDEAIRLHDKLLLILSEASMNSDWVGTEIANAREREAREKKQMLFPITLAPFEKVKSWKLFDADRGKDSAREIREYHIPDFSNWKDHDSYKAAFNRLVRDLKAVASG